MSHATHLVIDGHVHLYDCFAVQDVLQAGYRNLLHAVAQAPGPTGAVLPILVFTSTAWEPGFESLLERCSTDSHAASPGHWRIEPTDEDTSVWFRQEERLMLGVAGAQVVTSESLEVLLIGGRERPLDGSPAREVLDFGLARGLQCVLPWSAGKWWFGRGRLVSKLIADYRHRGLLLGDSAQRPALWSRPRHFERARALGLAILPGTDPLPFPAQARHVGRLSILCPASVDHRRPTADVLRALSHLGSSAATTAGKPFSLPRFVLNQVRMQLLKARG